MKRAFLPLLACLAAAPALAGPAAAPAAPPPARATTVTYATGSAPDYAVVEVGSNAPDFSFEGASGWRRLRDLRSEGHVLLVIGPDDETLLGVERERASLQSMGVTPVAVLDRRPGACRALSQRLRLAVRIVPDPQRVIGAQFNALDPTSRADAPAWFVVDRGGRVHALGRQSWPDRRWAEVAASALGIEAPPGAVSFGGR